MDNKPQSKAVTWEQLKSILERVHSPMTPGQKRCMPAISPAFYPPEVTRGRDTASGVSLLILDFDNAHEEAIPGEFFRDPRTGAPTARPMTRKVRIESPVTMAAVMGAISLAGVASLAWTTWSSSPEWEKFRVLIPLARPVSVDSWGPASEWALAHLDLGLFRRGLDLPVLHNPAALAFLPGSPAPASIRRGETAGAFLEVSMDAEASGRLPQSPWTPWQNDILDARRAERRAGDQWWMAYRVNGRPVDFKSLDLAAILKARGIQVGDPRPFKNGIKRRTYCPWANEHTGGLDDDAAVLITTPNSWPSFRCMHSGHAHMGLRDLLEWAWGGP